MFCIAAFVFLAVLGIFSGYYRNLAKKAWGCVGRRLTFRPCDYSVQEEIKAKLLGGIVLTKPRLYRFLNRWIDALAVVLLLLTILSVFSVVSSGLNLLVYDTCKPQNSESCSLGGEACAIGSSSLGFVDSVKQGKILTWVKNEASSFATTLALVPDRFKNWEPKDFTNEGSSYYQAFDPAKPIALEVIDPGCVYCSSLFDNIKQAGFEQKYNLTYIAYPIQTPDSPTGYKFANSYLIARYLEAVKMVRLGKQTQIAPDWQILEKIFTSKEGSLRIQDKFNNLYDDKQAREVLNGYLKEIGYSQEQINTIVDLVDSNQVKSRVESNRKIVEQEIRTVKIPTIIFEGRRYERLIGPEKLK